MSSTALAPVPQPCALHKLHAPKNLTTEWHHVIPVAWQLHTTLTVPPPFPGLDLDGRGMLWDDRGVSICPTGHRNVHHWIVALMRSLAQANVEDPLVAWKALGAAARRRPEAPVALQALQRYRAESQVSLLALTARGQWGEA